MDLVSKAKTYIWLVEQPQGEWGAMIEMHNIYSTFEIEYTISIQVLTERKPDSNKL